MTGFPEIDLSEMTEEEKVRSREAWDRWQNGRGERVPWRDHRRVLATRSLARAIVEQHPEITSTTGVRLDATRVEVVSPPFLSELWTAWPKAWFANCNEDVRETVAFVSERLRERGVL